MMSDLKKSLSDNPRFSTQMRVTLRVQVPQTHRKQVLDAITQACRLEYGDYDHVSFEEAEGTQRFRAIGTGRNSVTADVVSMPCVQITAQLPQNASQINDVISALYAAHPYEEPVITLTPSLSMHHVRGMDEDNPNRFWNQATPDWVPSEHR